MKTEQKHRTKSALLAAAPAAGQVYLSETATKTPRPTDEIKFEAQALSGAFIHIENGPVAVTPIKEDAWSARWFIEPADAGFVRIKNKWTGCYLNTEPNILVCDKNEKQGGWWSAQWQLLPDVDVKYSIINRWTGCKLTKLGSSRMGCMKNDKKTAENLWRPMNLAPQTAIVRRRPKPAAPPPAKASEPPAPQISDDIRAIFNTTDGMHGDEFTVETVTYKPRLAGNFEDDIETIDIYGQYATVIGYENENYTGRTVTLHCGRYELIGDPENEISSIKVIRAVRPEAECNYQTVFEIHRWD